jgi:hypothetical protein
VRTRGQSCQTIRDTLPQWQEDAFAAWREVTPIHHALVDAMVQSRLHLIATLRTKTESVVETKDGKTPPRKIGFAPIQREGFEYEYDMAADLDHEHTLIVHKSRCPALAGGVFPNPGKDVADILLAWLHGTPVPTSQSLAPAQPTAISPKTVFITATQLQSLVLFQKACGVADEVFKAYLRATYQIESRKLIPAVHYHAVREWLTQQRDQHAATAKRAAITSEHAS